VAACMCPALGALFIFDSAGVAVFLAAVGFLLFARTGGFASAGAATPGTILRTAPVLFWSGVAAGKQHWKDLWACGSSAREIAAFQYAANLRVVTVSLGPFAAAFGLLVGLSPQVYDPHWLASAVNWACAAELAHGCWRYRAVPDFASALKYALIGPAQGMGKVHGLQHLRPDAITVKNAARELWRAVLLVSFIVFMMALGCTLLITGSDFNRGDLQIEAWHRNTGTVAWSLAALLVGWGLRQRARTRLAELRQLQSRWLHYYSLSLEWLYAAEDGPDPDTWNWFCWRHFNDRDAEAPCPELDDRWMAFRGK